jgi:hypothetical protein
VEKKKQHLVPNCYLKAWCDPATPDGQEPFIWVHPAEGGEPKRKSPRKSFTETDRYTIESPSGDRNLRVEDTLADIETKFVGIRERLEGAQQISVEDHYLLCAFVATMSSRTKPAGDNWAETWDKVRSKSSRLAQAHGAKLDSPQLDDAVRNAYAHIVDATVKVLTPMLFHLRAGIYYAENRGAFITSDNPCVWSDPDSFRRPPAHRSPALCYPNIKILLPLSPNSLLLFGHDKRYAGYFRADEQFIDEVNRLTRFFSHEYFVTRDGSAKDFWFERRDLPADAWENTDEGKTSMARAEQYKKMREQYEAAKRAGENRSTRNDGPRLQN